MQVQERKQVVIGEIKVHYVGPDTWEFAPYYLSSFDNEDDYIKCPGVDPEFCQPNVWFEVHEVIYYNSYMILTAYECRYHMFSLHKGFVFGGPYKENHWQIKQESLDEFYKQTNEYKMQEFIDDLKKNAEELPQVEIDPDFLKCIITNEEDE